MPPSSSAAFSAVDPARRLTDFEEYMLVDSTVGYPMSCYIFFRFRGRGEETALRAAVDRAIAKHPLLCCSVEEERGGVYNWRDVSTESIFQRREGLPPFFFDRNGFFSPPFPAGGIDLFHEPPVKLSFWTDDRSEPETFLFAEIHHAASDGIGFIQFCEDVFLEYGGKTAQNYDPEELRRRGRFGLSLGDRLRMAPRQLIGLKRTPLFLMRRVRPLVPPGKEPETAKGNPEFWGRGFSIEETGRIFERAKSHGVTLNDMILAAVFQTMKDSLRDPAFCADSPSDPAALRGCLRLAVPINLRKNKSRRLSAANQASMVFLDRTLSEIQDSDVFLRQIHQEMLYIKKNGIGYAFMRGLKFFKSVCGGFERMCRGERCWTTGTVSNLGVLWRDPLAVSAGGFLKTGDLELIDVFSAPPIRKGSVFGIAVFTYARRFFLTVQYDPTALTRFQAEKLFRRLECRLIGGEPVSR